VDGSTGRCHANLENPRIHPATGPTDRPGAFQRERNAALPVQGAASSNGPVLPTHSTDAPRGSGLDFGSGPAAEDLPCRARHAGFDCGEEGTMGGQHPSARGARERLRWRAMLAALLLLQAAAPTSASEGETDLGLMSIEDLLDVEVTSVSKRAQKVADAPAAVTVLTGEDIRRSGATSIPEALRMVPGLHVAQIDGSKWAITARGFNSQFANKLLVLIDGRSVYTPLFSGVFWDVQDVMLEDVDRIEVVRGPGGTLWGANAVNGVINIITKPADATQGLLVAAGAGSIDRYFTQTRIGGSLGHGAHYRVYAKYFDRASLETDTGASAHDGWDMARGGFRVDWNATGSDSLTFQGDFYDGDEDDTLLTGTQESQAIRGGNFLTRWNHEFSNGSATQFQLYYDRTDRNVQALLTEKRNTVDLELQHRFQPLRRHDVVVGAGYRMNADHIDPRLTAFSPESRTDHLASSFVQDEITLIENLLSVTLGSKFEYNDYTGFEFQPSGRSLYTPSDRHSLWAAISRAVRTPSRADNDVAFTAPSQDLPATFDTYAGNRGLDSETLLAYEIGYRGRPLDSVSLDVAAYYNDYEDIRSNEVLASVPCPSPPLPPATTCRTLQFGNGIDASGWGVEASATWVATPFWQLQAGYSYMDLDVEIEPGSTDTTSVSQEGDTPRNQFFALSRVNLPFDLEFDTSLYWVQGLRSQPVDDYTRLDLRLGWRPLEQLELSLVGQNLTESRHEEFENGLFLLRSQVPRSVYGKVTWRR
jgi:iron complex outermembrane receptor protein